MIDLGLVKLGIEIEVPDWKKPRTYYSVCSDLVEAGYMFAPAEQWAKHHKYHCACAQGGCDTVRRGNIIYPPLVSMTYDASLPKTGAEFIVSPILLSGLGLDDRMEDIWNIVTRDAIWTNKMDDYHGTGNKCSPSVHFHVSATLNHDERKAKRRTMFESDILHALSLFSPELFALASTASNRRGIKFRLPTRSSIDSDVNTQVYGHHGFVQVKQAVPNEFVYIEWRLFEASYDSFEYFESAAYLSAALTRSLLNPSTVTELMSMGYRNPFDTETADKIIATDNTNKFLGLADMERFTFLGSMCLEALHDDDYGRSVVDRLFLEAGRSVLS